MDVKTKNGDPEQTVNGTNGVLNEHHCEWCSDKWCSGASWKHGWK